MHENYIKITMTIVDVTVECRHRDQHSHEPYNNITPIRAIMQFLQYH
jgi:hypothetical protein